MFLRLHIAIMLVVFSTLNVFGQSTDRLKVPKPNRVSGAYGYLIAQEYSLGIIKEEFPQYKMRVLGAEALFRRTFGDSKEGMKKFLAEYLNSKIIYELEDRIKKMVNDQIFTEELAENFISEVESRARGNIPSPVLETLLSFQFSERPQDEFTRGHIVIFKTKGHLKSKNTDWQVQVPQSWRSEEAGSSNVIQTFTSDFGSGNQSIILMNKEISLDNRYEISKIEIDEFFTEKEVKQYVPGEFISFTKMTFYNNVGGMMVYEQIGQNLDIKIKMRFANFTFIRENILYSLQCTVSSTNIEEDLSLEFDKYLPLFKLVANSIVVNDQY